MEKIVLSRPTYNRLSDGANLANDLADKATSPRGLTPQKPRAKQYLAKLTEETTTPNGGLTWKAKEVYLDETGSAVEKVDGFEWTDDNPVFTLNAASINDVIMVSQSGRPAIDPDPAKRYWFGNPGGGGGGGGTLFANVTSVTDQQNYIGNIYEAPSLSATPVNTGVAIKAENINYGQLTIGNSFHTGAFIGLNFHISPTVWG